MYMGDVMAANCQVTEAPGSTSTFEPLLSAEEAASYLRMHPKTLQKMARGGQVPCIRYGRNWYFRLSALDAWVREQENRCSQPFCVK